LTSPSRTRITTRIARATRSVLQVLRAELCPRYNWCGIHERFDAVSIPSAGFSDDCWALDTRALTCLGYYASGSSE